MVVHSIIEQFQHQLIVSCQALQNEPLYGSHHMAAIAIAAAQGGAAGIRANTPEDILAIKEKVQLPIIGLYKFDYPDSQVYITPTLKEVSAVIEAGADIVAVDATDRMRPDGQTLEIFMEIIKKAYPKMLFMADVSTFKEGVTAMDLGFNLVSTTLSGYTPYSVQQKEPDIELVSQLSKLNRVPVIAEGRIWTSQQLVSSFEAGAYAVVMGTAITRPQDITRHYVDHIIKHKQ